MKNEYMIHRSDVMKNVKRNEEIRKGELWVENTIW